MSAYSELRTARNVQECEGIKNYFNHEAQEDLKAYEKSLYAADEDQEGEEQ